MCNTSWCFESLNGVFLKQFEGFINMSAQIKQKVAKNFYDALRSKVSIGHYGEFLERFSLMRSRNNQVIWKVDLPNSCGTSLDTNFFVSSQRELIDNKTVKNIKFLNEFNNSNSLQVELDLKTFIKDVIDSDPTKLEPNDSPKKIIFEFSSPNIAKRFHIGHLRSTNIGNALSNIKKKFENDVLKINYLGDWGTQFGLIQLGMNLENYSEEDLKRNPLDVLFKAYVRGNTEAEKDIKLFEEAKKIFFDLEFEVEDIVQKWNKYKEWTVTELSTTYNRLGVSFDEYNWESDYKRNKADYFLKILDEKGILSVDEKGRKVAVLEENKFPLLKSDDTTLYLLRDLMAVKDRRSKHAFDEMYYVVDNGQADHFQKLFKLASHLNLSEGAKMEHVKFGKIHGMSTRKGTVVFLSDILNEAQERVYRAQAESKNTKVSLETRDVADILGVSAVIINDLRHRRLRDYQFSWEEALQLKGDSGVPLQYTHCRLSNLEVQSGKAVALECDPEALLEPEAVHLILTIAKYEECLRLSNAILEPCILVKFLFDLVSALNLAYKRLNVKHTDTHVAGQRLLMFKKGRQVLNEGMRILGLKPLNEM